ncbi:MAG TPA: heavy-metal-associated domain-containing protein [Ktedonobacteraceae bacterium]|jgi:copper chaperone CopZ|nr:heavy-metal-associated domain-containing protein [Ktedonobacteraceae bacterium]
MSDTQTTILNIPGMHCEDCVRKITKVVNATHGIQTVQIDLGTKTVQLVYDPEELLIAEFEAKLAENGYPATKQPLPRPGRALPLH